MKFILTFILSGLYLTSFCQINAKDIEHRDTIVGKKTDGTDIIGTKYKFQHSILEYYVDSVNNRLILILQEKKKRHIISLNTDSLRINWSKETNSKNFFFTPNTIIEQSKDNSKCYAPQSGDLMWERKPHFMIFDQIMEIGITEKGSGYNLRTGNEIWMRNLDYATGLQSVTKTDDSSLFLMTTQALHRVNTITSKGWKYNVLPINAAYNRGSTIIIATGPAAGLIGSLAASALMAAYEKHQERKNSLKLSNAISEGLKTYIVSDKKLACMNAEDLEWEVEMPNNFIAPSVIKSTNNHIWVFGKKTIKEKHRKEKPAYFVFDKLTGNAKWEFTEDSSTDLKDIIVQNDHLIILFNDRLYIVDATTNTILTNLGTTELTNSCTRFFEPASFQVEDGRKLTSLKERYPDHIFLNKDTNTIYRYNEQFVFQDSVATQSLFLPYASYQGNIITRNSKEPNTATFITNGEKKANIYSDQVFFANDRIIAIKDNYILSIDLAQLN